MANWSKRSTTKAGNSGQRITRTRSTSGKQTYTTSYKPAKNSPIRIGTTFKTDGSPKSYMTVTNPVTGRRTTTINGGTPKIKQIKEKKTRLPKGLRNQTYSNFGDQGSLILTFFEVTIKSLFWGFVALIALSVFAFIFLFIF